MRTDPITKEIFVPNNPNHYFASDDSFISYLDTIDPVDEFKPVKREINWSPQERVDPRSGKTFFAEHPAQIYAPDEEE